MIRSILRVALAGALFVLTLGVSQAKPEFAKKEGKNCNYCHAPAPPKLGYRALYYKAHNFSFAEFDDAAEAKKVGAEVGPDPEPKPASWSAPKAGGAPKPTEAPKAPEAPKGPSVAELKKKAAAAAAAYKKNPKTKVAYAQALAELGTATMYDASVPPVKRYPEALRILRQAKGLDPKNKLALEGIKEIEDAYKTMNKPIPK